MSKLLNNFHGRSNTKCGKASSCKECAFIRTKDWREANSERHSENSKTWAKENPEKVKTQHLIRAYGITLEDKKRMAEEQEYKCLICNREKKLGELVVDHAH